MSSNNNGYTLPPSGKSINSEKDSEHPTSSNFSRAYTNAISRGKTRLEKKSTWPFDYYQTAGFFPVDYHYFWTPYTTDFGSTELTMMYAVAYADGEPFSADQMQYKYQMREAHNLAVRAIP